MEECTNVVRIYKKIICTYIPSCLKENSYITFSIYKPKRVYSFCKKEFTLSVKKKIQIIQNGRQKNRLP